MKGTLLDIRKLNDFFRGAKNPKPEDFFAADFPTFADQGEFISAPDLEDLHRRIAHMTLRSPKCANFDILKAVELGMSRYEPFLDYLANEFFAGEQTLADEARTDKRGFQNMLNLWIAKAKAAGEYMR